MDIGALLKTFIYLIASSLLYPVLFLLVVITIWIVVYSGSFLAEWIARSRIKKTSSDNLCDKIKDGNAEPFFSKRAGVYLNTLKNLVKSKNNSEIKIETLLQEASIKIEKSIDRLRMLVRISPSLGLIGTLIPMGTGLAALGQGDLTQLSADLVIAFTTTVVGIATGTAAFVLYTVKKRWLEQDIKSMELATEILASEIFVKEVEQGEIL